MPKYRHFAQIPAFFLTYVYIFFCLPERKTIKLYTIMPQDIPSYVVGTQFAMPNERGNLSPLFRQAIIWERKAETGSPRDLDSSLLHAFPVCTCFSPLHWQTPTKRTLWVLLLQDLDGLKGFPFIVLLRRIRLSPAGRGRFRPAITSSIMRHRGGDHSIERK